MPKGSLSPEVASARGRVAALTRSRAEDDPERIDARTNLAVAKLEDYITRVVAAAPPLATSQRNHLAALFGGAA
ncbi:MAG: hypothetical protein K0R99_4762 [Microbacterium sp.]|nr:hypothetical protein [Microbacterium sp.]